MLSEIGQEPFHLTFFFWNLFNFNWRIIVFTIVLVSTKPFLYVESEFLKAKLVENRFSGCQKGYKMYEGGREVQTPSYELNNFWGRNIQHGAYS